ncbi:MAG TPA: D-arabinono-1,4-lactone oxidase [Terriglobia bacterium]|nr:D-arabinono-1,4-lactone oxidase [Terriglobia bacterium]
MADCKSNYTFDNWARTIKFKPERFCEPASEADVIALVKEALAKGETVRTQGAGHSWSGFVVTDKTLLQLDKLNKGLIADVLKRRYTVQAGIRLKDLINNLALDGLAMKNLGSITEQSIAGAISTGTHGTGLRLGNISSSIVGMKLVTGTGDVLTIKESDGDLLEAARVSIGMLGVITEVTIEVVPLYNLEHNTYLCRFDDVIDKIDTLNQENERFLIWWLVAPIGPKDNCLVITSNPPGTPPGLLGQAGTPPAGNAGRNTLPMDTNDLLTMILKLFQTKPPKPFLPVLKQTGRYDRMITIPLLPVLHREFEYAIPVENTSEALRAMKRVIDEGDIATTLPIEVRFVAKDNILLSPARGRDVSYIGVSTQPNANEVYERIEPILKDFGGRPHWGKCCSLRRSEVEAMYPDSYDKFRQIKKELDPNGVFSNTLIHQLFD